MLRLIQVGMGGWGRDWAKHVLAPDPAVTLVAAVDADPVALARARQELALPAERTFASLPAALAAHEAEAVLITANLPGHVPLATEALRAGKHVLLEKPFAPTLVEARAVVALAAQQQRLLMISQNYRFYPAVQAVRDLVRGGTLGAVGAVNIDFRRYANAAPPDGHRHYTLSQPLLSDMAIHHFDLLRAVLGQEPVEVACHAWNPPWSQFREPAAAVATIRFDGGAMVSYRGSWVSPGPPTPWAGEWRMECAEGEIAWTSRADRGLGAERVTVRPPGGRGRRLELPAPAHIDRAGSLRAFAHAIATGTPPESTGRDNLGSLALMQTAIAAAAQGRPLLVDAGD